MIKELLFSITKKDFEISYYSGSGAGGQHRNKHKNCVRIIHKPSGAMATGADSKSLDQNKKNAFKRLTNNDKFKSWLKIEIAKRETGFQEMNRKINAIVDKAMEERNLKIEYL